MISRINIIYPFLPKFELLHIKNSSLFFSCFFKYITCIYFTLFILYYIYFIYITCLYFIL